MSCDRRFYNRQLFEFTYKSLYGSIDDWGPQRAIDGFFYSGYFSQNLPYSWLQIDLTEFVVSVTGVKLTAGNNWIDYYDPDPAGAHMTNLQVYQDLPSPKLRCYNIVAGASLDARHCRYSY